MDAYEATRMVFSRIQTLDPENAAKIIGLLLIQDHYNDKEMIRLALGPEALIHSLILKSKRELGLQIPQCSSPEVFASEPKFVGNDYQEMGLKTNYTSSHLDFDYLPFTPSSFRCRNYLLLQQQIESQRVAAAAAAALMMGERSRMMNPASRQIYLTFPADSTFREEDVSNYFSIYGPVQDVRIPYQQKRMFGFVTFVYPETVRLILAKGNPHFVCDARVLVKPYKEKGKLQEKKQQQQLQIERGDFYGYASPTGFDSRDPYEFQQFGAKMMFNNGSSSQEMLLRRRLEEAELQQAIEMQERRFMGLQLLDFKNRSLSLSSPTTISSPATISSFSSGRSNEDSPTEDKSPSPLSSSAGKEESAARETITNACGDFQESNAEHNLPDSPFASPIKASSFEKVDPFSAFDESQLVAASAHNNGDDIGNVNAKHHIAATTLMPSTSNMDLASFKSCFFQMPRYPSGHGADGM